MTERQTKEVPLSYEEVEVDFRPVDRRPTDQPVGADESVSVPVHKEQVAEVDKRTVVTGEIDVRTREAEATKRVSGAVRREEPRVEREGDLRVRGDLEETERP